MDHASADDMPLGAETPRRQTQVIAEIMEVRTADIAQVDTFEIGPDAFIGIQVWGMTGQLVQTPPCGTARGKKLFDGPTAMNRRAVPDHEQFAGQVAQEVAEELHHVWRAERMILF